VTFEEGTSAAWLHDLLKAHVTEVLVCDSRKNALLKSGNKNDRVDARKLAELLYLNKLNPVYHGETGVRTLRELARSYLASTRDLTRVMNRLQAIYRSWAIPCAGQQVYAPRCRSEWLAKIREDGVRRRGTKCCSRSPPSASVRCAPSTASATAARAATTRAESTDDPLGSSPDFCSNSFLAVQFVASVVYNTVVLSVQDAGPVDGMLVHSAICPPLAPGVGIIAQLRAGNQAKRTVYPATRRGIDRVIIKKIEQIRHRG
jgi:Transposase